MASGHSLPQLLLLFGLLEWSGRANSSFLSREAGRGEVGVGGLMSANMLLLNKI